MVVCLRMCTWIGETHTHRDTDTGGQLCVDIQGPWLPPTEGRRREGMRKGGGMERGAKRWVFVLASTEAKPPPPTPWGLPPPHPEHLPLPRGPCRISLPDTGSLAHACFLHLHWDPSYFCKLSHWQSAKEKKGNVS